MMAVLDAINPGGKLSAVPAAETGAEDRRHLVGCEPPQAEFAAALEQLVDRKVALEDEVAYARNHGLPIEWAEKGVRKEDHVLPWLRRMTRANRYGVYFIFKSMEQGSTFRITVPKYPTADPNYRILAHQRSRFTHYYFYIRDEVLGPMAIRVASFFPFQTTYYLNGHSFIEQELTRAQIGFRKNDNAFLAVDDVAALQAAADRLSADIIRQRLDYWTFLLGPKFSARERKAINLSRFYAIAQIEYCRGDAHSRRRFGLISSWSTAGRAGGETFEASAEVVGSSQRRDRGEQFQDFSIYLVFAKGSLVPNANATEDSRACALPASFGSRRRTRA